MADAKATAANPPPAAPPAAPNWFYDQTVGALRRATSLTASYIEEHWTTFSAFLFASSAVVLGMGILFGFPSTAFPLALGFGCGLPFGALLGFATEKCLGNERGDPVFTLVSWIENKFKNYSSAVCYAAATILITTLIIFTSYFPTIFGTILGAVVSDHVIVQVMLSGKRAQNHPPHAPD